jgi:hypothetical protein
MDSKRQAEFVAKMKRQKYAKGGLVKRKHYDAGGGVSGPETVGNGSPTVASGALSPGGTLQGVGSSLGIPANSGVGQAFGAVTALNPMNTQNQFQAVAAPLQMGTTASQLNTAYGQAQSGLQQQQDFTNQLSQQNGIGNESNVYNQEQAIANGQGPNPAQAMLNQQTGQNVANQAALMAGQRGASSNAGLIARQAAQQGAATNQQAVGQGASMQANQSLNALNSAGQMAQNQVNQQGQAITGYNTAAQNEQSGLQTANSNYNNAKVGMQSNVNNVNGQVSQGNQAANNGLMGGLMNGGGLSSMLAKGGVVGSDGRKVSAITIHPRGYTQHYDDGGSVDFGDAGYTPEASSSTPNIGSMASTDEGSEFASKGGGGGGGGGGLMALAALAKGGEVDFGTPGYVAEGSVGAPSIGSMGSTDESAAFANLGKSKSGGGQQKPGMMQKAMGKMKGGGQSDQSTNQPANNPAEPNATMMQSDQDASAMPADPGTMMAAHGGHVCTENCGPHKSHVANFLARGGMPGKVPAMVSPGEVYLSPDAVKKVVEQGANPMQVGEHFKGKAKVKGDSLKNDNIPRTLDAGGVVIPRHITTHKMAPEKAELFVHRALAKRRMK